MNEMFHNLLSPHSPVWWSYDITLAMALITMVIMTRLAISELRR